MKDENSFPNAKAMRASRRIDGNELKEMTKSDILNFGNRIVNCWAYYTDNGYVIIDTGYEHNYKTFKKNLKVNSVAIDQIAYCFLTHAHDDHAGFINQLLSDNQYAKIIMSNKGIDTLRKGQNSFVGGCTSKSALAFCNIMRLFGKGQHAFPPIKSEYESRLIFISDENQVRLKRELNGKIIETAGHTSDSISLFLNDGCLFCGDAAMNGFLSKHNITIWAEDSVAFLQSWNSIIALQPAKIFPGHGKPFDVRFLKRNVGFAENIKGS